jgi:hypothetical protein
MSYLEMLALLEKGGCDVSTFNRGLKWLEDLHQEITSSDVILQLANYQGRLRAVRTAMNVRSLIIWKDSYGSPQYLCETGRNYRNGVWRDFKPYGLSETRKRGESATQAVLRGFSEEYQLTDIENQVVNCPGPDQHHIHESKVYRGIVSEVYSQNFIFYSPTKFREDGLLPEPDGTQIWVEWKDEETLVQNGLISVPLSREGHLLGSSPRT